MEEITLPKIQTIKEEKNYGLFVIEPLYPGYGQTVGNSLRRILYSSLEGAAVSSVKIEGVAHEFSTISGIKEDIIELILNLKQLRMRLIGDEPAKMTLNVKGPKKVYASFIKTPSQIEIINKDLYLVTLDDSKATLSMEIIVEKGRGYVPVEMKAEKPEIGVIQTDSLFSPVLGVSYKVENTRVGQRTDFNKLTLEIQTDGTITPEEAIRKAAEILVKQFDHIKSLPSKKAEVKKKKVKEKKKKEIKSEKKVTKKKRSKKSPA